jgi:hypothetical protein
MFEPVRASGEELFAAAVAVGVAGLGASVFWTAGAADAVSVGIEPACGAGAAVSVGGQVGFCAGNGVGDTVVAAPDWPSGSAVTARAPPAPTTIDAVNRNDAANNRIGPQLR